MRSYKYYGCEDSHIVKSALAGLASENTDKYEYRNAFLQIGSQLGRVLKHKLPVDYAETTMLACSSEDADWLAQGILEGLDGYGIPIAVFWTKRMHLNDGIDVASIFRSYQDELRGECKALIIAKSIINSSCVVKTQLLRLISTISPERILVVAPVMFKDATSKLRQEFPDEISEKFEFVTFAVDDVVKDGVVIPGIGGWVYTRLGFGSEEEKNRYIPMIVKDRMSPKIPSKPFTFRKAL